MADAAVLTPAQLAAVMAGRPLPPADADAEPSREHIEPAGPSSAAAFDAPMAALGCSATFAPFYTGSATGNGTSALPLLYTTEQGPAPTLLFTALDDTVAVTLSTTAQTVARITHKGLASPAELAEEDPDTPLGDGDAVQVLALADSKWPAPAREEDMEEDEAALVASSTLLVATQARFLRTYSVRVYASGASVDVKVTLARTTAKAHEAPILVMRTSADIARSVRGWADKHGTTSSPNTAPVNLLATGSADGMVKVWDVAGGYVTHVLRGHGGPVSALHFFAHLPRHAPAGERRLELVTGAVDGRVRVWDLLQAADTDQANSKKKTNEVQADKARGAVQQKPAATLELHDSVVRGISMSDDGSRLVTSSRDTTIGLWTRQLHPSSKDRSFKNLDLAASGSLKSAAAWKQKEVIDCSEGIESVGFLPSPALFVPRGESAAKAAKSEEQDLFYSAGSQGLLRLWSFSRGQVVVVAPSLGPAPKEGDDDVHAVQQVHLLPPFSSSTAELGQLITLVTVQMDQTFAVRTCPTLVHQGSTAAPTPVAERPLHLAQLLVGTEDQLADVALVNPLGTKTSTHFALATNVPEVHVARLPPALGAPRSQRGGYASTALLAGHTGMVLALAASSNGQWLATASRDRTVRVWACATASESDSGLDAAQGWRCLAVASGHTESVGAIRFAPRPSPATGLPPFLVSASSDRTLKVWDLSPLADLSSSLQEVTEPVRLASLTTLKVHERDANAVDVAPDNGLILTGSQDRTARLFQLTFTPPTHKKKGTNRTASASLVPVATVKGHKRGVWGVRFSPSDRAFATGGGDRVARLWALPPPQALGSNALAGSGGAAGQGEVQCVRTFEGHSAAVLRVEFAARGTQLLTSSSDGLVKLWSVKDETCLWTGDAHYTSVFGLAVLPPTPARTQEQGQEETVEDVPNAVTRVVSVGADARVRVWDDVTRQRKLEEQRKRVEQVEQEQEFETRLAAHDWSGAIKLALARNHPRRLLELFTHVAGLRPRLPKETGIGAESAAAGALLASMLGKPLPGTQGTEAAAAEKDALSITGQAEVDTVLAELSRTEAGRLLHHVRDWNTAARTAGVAQTVLHALLRLHSAGWLLAALETPSKRGKEDEAKEDKEDKFAIRMDAPALLAALRPYTERHYARSDRLMTEAAVLDYTLHALDAVVGMSDSEDDGDNGAGDAEDVAMADSAPDVGPGSESEEVEVEAEAMRT